MVPFQYRYCNRCNRAHYHDRNTERPGCFVDQLFSDNNHLEINVKRKFMMLRSISKNIDMSIIPRIINENFITNDRGN